MDTKTNKGGKTMICPSCGVDMEIIKGNTKTSVYECLSCGYIGFDDDLHKKHRTEEAMTNKTKDKSHGKKYLKKYIKNG